MSQSRGGGHAGSRRATLVGAGGMAAVGVVWSLAGCSASHSPDSTVPASSSHANGASATAGSSAEATAGGDVYRVSGEDNPPGGPEPFEVEVTLDENVITAVTFTPQATNSESNRFQRIFAKQISDQVLGKTLDEARAVRISGASLTSEGFAEALAQIEQQAG
ncbi:hypothetical protein GCM10009785_22360 [Brooklawnia cerclae]|uniref:Uncharacterized protein with FMN-binding domain n=1 Tax=Brooklawnia cerclae TaxID=349934 RepID=A0ABX0SGL4_9ACTN|nr:FMN-binding protein [Brooklawnia cerclae]NIH57130.1 uncharacterized protein with FMN-binding domain [Brooklawnia cerclae]